MSAFRQILLFGRQQICDDVTVNIVQTLPLIIKMFYTINCKRLHIMLFKTYVQILMKKIQFHRELFKELVHD